MGEAAENEVRVPVRSRGEPVALLIGRISGGKCTVTLVDPAPKANSGFAPEGELILIPETKFDPKFEKQRRWLVKEIRERLSDDEVGEEEAKEAVYELCARLIEALSRKPQTRSAPVQEEADEAWMAEAQEILRDSDLMGRILRLLERKGYVKDEVVKKVLLYACLSAFTDEPINVFLKGPSSSGKSFGATQVASLFPKESVWLVGRMSPTALIHSKGECDEGGRIIVDLRGKILVFLENAQKETLEMLLPILSHDSEEIVYKITDKAGKGNLRTKEVIIKGFPAAIFCSSRLKLLDDLKTRSMIITPEMTAEKTLAANIAYARKFMEPNSDKADEEEEKIKAALRLLAKEGGKVLISFAKALAKAFPQDSHGEMRNFKKLLSMIYLNAFLHKYQRHKLKVGDEEFILATEDDYKVAVNVFNEIAPATRSGVPEYVKKFYEDVLAAIPEDEERYSRNIIRKYSKVFSRPLGYSTYREYVRLLEDAGWVLQEPHPTDKRRKMIILNKKGEKLLRNAPSNLEEVFTRKDFESWLTHMRKIIVEKAGVPHVIIDKGTTTSTTIIFGMASKQNTGEKEADKNENLLRAIGSNFERESEEKEHEPSEITQRHKASLREVTDDVVEAALEVLRSIIWDGWEASRDELMSAVRHISHIRQVSEGDLLAVLMEAGLTLEEGTVKAPEDILARIVRLRKHGSTDSGGDAE